MRKENWVLGLASFAVVLNAVLEINLPFNSDELLFSYLYSVGDWSGVNPFRSTQYHALSTFLSYLSLKTFGNTVWAARLPGIFFTSCFVAFFCFFAKKNLKTFSILFILLHFLSNELIVWYFHSPRGYAPLMLFSFILFSIFYSMTKDNPQFLSSKQKVVFALLVAFPVVAHLFYGFFLVLMVASFLLWFLMIGRKREPAFVKEYKSYLKIFFGLAGVLFLIALWEFFGTGAYHGLMGAKKAYELEPNLLGGLFGVARLWYTKLWLLFVFCFLVGAGFKERVKSFSFIFLSVSAVSFCSAIFILKAAFFSRLVLPWLLVFLFWLFVELEKMSFLKQSISYVALFFLLVAIPLTHRTELATYIGNLAGIHRTSHFLLSTAAPLASHCITFSGDKEQVEWARNFYLSEQSPGIVKSEQPCPKKYHVFFGQDLTRLTFSSLDASSLVNAKVIYKDGFENQVLEYQP